MSLTFPTEVFPIHSGRPSPFYKNYVVTVVVVVVVVVVVAAAAAAAVVVVVVSSSSLNGASFWAVLDALSTSKKLIFSLSVFLSSTSEAALTAALSPA